MFKNYFKIAIRNLKREKTYSLINIFGLSVGMSAFVLIVLLTQFMNSFDKFNKNYNRIYRVQQEERGDSKTEWTQTIYPLAADNISRSISFVRSKFKSFFPNEVFEVQLYDTGFDKETQAVWEGVQNTFGFFSAMAIIIAVIGLLGLVSFSTRRRTKEIGIRKVLGATESGLYFLVTREFLILLGAAILFAAPAAYTILVTAPGAYKYSLTTMDFVIPLTVVIAATVIVTLRQVLSVTKANPAQSLHYE